MARTQKPPAHYPFLPFHAIRTCSLVSSAIVSAILLYFCYHLKHDNYDIPWTFLVVLASSLFTLIALTLTFIIHVCHTLSPLLNLFLNIPILILWLLGLGLLGYNMSGTLAHTCNTANWGNETGIMICQTYKALFSFVIIGTISAIAQVVLDFRVRHQQTRQGAYNQMVDPVSKNVNPHESGDLKFAGGGNITDIAMEPYRNQGLDLRDSNPYGRSSSANREDINMQRFGYGAPTEQTSYDAGSYGHGQRY